MTLDPDALDPASEASYFASIWGLSNPKMKALEVSFQKFLDAGRKAANAVEAVRALIKPDTILMASEIDLPAFPRKAVFNALTYLTRTGELAHIGYGKYQSPPADPSLLSTSEQIARDLRDGTFQGASGPSTIVEEPTGWTPEKYAEQLAVSTAAKHYPEVPQWRPLTGDIMGLLSQIDNMLTGLVRSPQPHTGRAGLDDGTRKTLIETAEGLEMSATAEQFVFDGLQPMVDRFHAGDHAPEVMRSLRVYNDSRHNKDWWRKQAAAVRAALNAALTVEPAHPDDAAVDRFAVAMKAKLAKKRAEGRGGWERKDECTAEFLSELLRGHVEKGDPLDVGNLAMMLHQRGERILTVEPEAGEVTKP